jgi:hypothetical protein
MRAASTETLLKAKENSPGLMDANTLVHSRRVKQTVKVPKPGLTEENTKAISKMI